MKELKIEVPKVMVGVVMGSASDKKILEESGCLDVLDECGVAYGVSVISAHRNPEELYEYCRTAVSGGVKAFIAAAGMSAALAGAIGANIKFQLPVIGVALSSTEFSNGLDALFAIVRIPGGCPIVCAGIGKAGLKNAALIAAQILAISEDVIGASIRERFSAYLRNNAKLPEMWYETNVEIEED